MGKVLAFDVETPNSHNDRICSIGLSLIDDGTIVWSQNYLVNPECSFDNRNIQIHGIHPQDVATAPTFPLVWNEIGSLFRQNLIIAHNATFDLCVLKKTLSAYGISEALVYYACTMQMAQSELPDLPNLKLPTLCDYYDIELNHHDSGSDSSACAQIFCHMLGEGIRPEDFTKAYSLECTQATPSHSQPVHMAANTKGLLTLSGILSGITCDNVLVPSEVDFLQNWLDDNVELKGNYPYDKIYSTIAAALSDGILDRAELESMLRLFKQVSDSERIDDVILKRLSDTLGIPTSYLLGGSIRIKDLVKDWHSNKAGRFYMSIDSDLLDLLGLFAKEDGLSLEDEVERILHEEAERRIDDRVNEESAKEIQEYYQRRYQSQESLPEDE